MVGVLLAALLCSINYLGILDGLLCFFIWSAIHRRPKALVRRRRPLESSSVGFSSQKVVRLGSLEFSRCPGSCHDSCRKVVIVVFRRNRRLAGRKRLLRLTSYCLGLDCFIFRFLSICSIFTSFTASALSSGRWYVTLKSIRVKSWLIVVDPLLLLGGRYDIRFGFSFLPVLFY